MKRIDLTGQKSGRLTVIDINKIVYSTSPSGTKQAKVYWNCVCDCGNSIVKSTIAIRNNVLPSCGCWNREVAAENGRNNISHGLSKTAKYKLFNTVKARAKLTNLDFDLEMGDLVIPDSCPVLGIPIFHGDGTHSNHSPSVDRFDNNKGYTKDNIKVISRRANCLKNDATIDELEAIVKYMKGDIT